MTNHFAKFTRLSLINEGTILRSDKDYEFQGIIVILIKQVIMYMKRILSALRAVPNQD